MIFQPHLAQLILEGKKTATRRAMNDNPRSPWRSQEPLRYPVGQVFAIQPGRGKEAIGHARVTARYTAALWTMDHQDAQAEGFPTLGDFRETWEAINGGFDFREEVHVIEFKLVDLDPEHQGGEHG